MTTGCQSTTEDYSAGSLPWSDDPRGDAKTELLKYARENPEGVRPVVAARAVLNPNASASGSDVQLARRFYESHPDLFKTDRRNGSVWIEPTTVLLRVTLLDTASKHTVGTQDGGDPNPDTRDDSANIALSNAKGILRRRKVVDSDEVRGDLLGAFAAKRKGTEDRYHTFEDSFNRGSHLLVPYATRFNSARRVQESRERYRTAWKRAGDRYGRAVVLTLTTDPNRFESQYAAADGLLSDVNAVKDWLEYEPANGPKRPGFRPPSIVVPEFTERGVPHVHIVFFGVSWLVWGEALESYWSGSRNRAQIKDFERLTFRSGRWRWAGSGPENAKTRSPREYLEKNISLLAASANSSAAEVREAANALRNGDTCSDAFERGVLLWKAALLWATDLPAFTVSPEFREPRDRPERLMPARWQYVGTAKYGQFPASVRSNAVVLSRSGDTLASQPPPNTLTAVS